MVLCLVTLTDLQTRRAGLSASAALLVDILSVRLRPSLYILSCPFECNKAAIICQIMYAFEFSSLFISSTEGPPFILPSIISCKSPSCLKAWPIHRCFLCQIEFNICLSSFTLLRTSLLVTLSSQLIFSIFLHIHISKASCKRYRINYPFVEKPYLSQIWIHAIHIYLL